MREVSGVQGKAGLPVLITARHNAQFTLAKNRRFRECPVRIFGAGDKVLLDRGGRNEPFGDCVSKDLCPIGFTRKESQPQPSSLSPGCIAKINSHVETALAKKRSVKAVRGVRGDEQDSALGRKRTIEGVENPR